MRKASAMSRKTAKANSHFPFSIFHFSFFISPDNCFRMADEKCQMTNGNDLRPHFHSRLSLQLAPADDRAARGGRDRFHHYVVHHLAVTESLQEKPPQQAPALFALEQKREGGGDPVNCQKQRVIEQDLAQIRERKT